MDQLEWIFIIGSKIARQRRNRFELWTQIIDGGSFACCAEIGVYKGHFSQAVLERCPGICTYFMVEPWRHLDDWNKPANKSDDQFQRIKAEALERTRFAENKLRILEGTTTEVSDQLPTEGLDFAYIDGDHTLKGITIDLLRVWPKMKAGGILGGDDFFPSVWQHGQQFEPTFVFPLAVYFAQGIGSPIYALPFNQFAILVDRSGANGFQFHDFTGQFRSTNVKDAIRIRRFDAAGNGSGAGDERSSDVCRNEWRGRLMRIVPVLDLLDGQVVRGIAGRRNEYRPIRSVLTDKSDPPAVANAIRKNFGLNHFYIADLDAILHHQPQLGILRSLSEAGLSMMVDAGIRIPADAESPLGAGARQVVAGLETLSGPDAFSQLVRQWGANRVVFSLDLREGRPMGDNSVDER